LRGQRWAHRRLRRWPLRGPDKLCMRDQRLTGDGRWSWSCGSRTRRTRSGRTRRPWLNRDGRAHPRHRWWSWSQHGRQWAWTNRQRGCSRTRWARRDRRRRCRSLVGHRGTGRNGFDAILGLLLFDGLWGEGWRNSNRHWRRIWHGSFSSCSCLSVPFTLGCCRHSLPLGVCGSPGDLGRLLLCCNGRFLCNHVGFVQWSEEYWRSRWFFRSRLFLGGRRRSRSGGRCRR
jgi:hypothetical protein